MNWWRRVFARARLERELDAELRDHVERQTADLVATGINPAEARRQALASLGGVDPVKEYCRDVRSSRSLERLLLDCRYGIRRTVRDPWFSASVVLTVALGIASTIALLGVFDIVVLRALPYRDPQRLAIVWSENRGDALSDGPVSWPDLEDWRHASTRIDTLAAFRNRPSFITRRDGDLVVEAHEVTAEFLPSLGTPTVLGRMWSAREVAEGREEIAVISHALWQGAFGGDPNVIGKTIALSHVPYEVIGVMPAGFRSPSVTGPSAVGLSPALALWSPFVPRSRQFLRGNRGLRVLGRLHDASGTGDAQADLERVAANLARAYPDTNLGRGVRVVPLAEAISGQTRPALFLLLGAAALVLLLSASNATGLVLVRATARGHEFAIRTAIGATRARVASLLLVEGLCLSTAGTLAGVGLAAFLLRAVPLQSFVADLPMFADAGLDQRVLAVSVLLALTMGIGLGVAPLLELHLFASPVQSGGDRATADRRIGRVRRMLVGAQVAIAVVLASGAVLLLVSFWWMTAAQGFREPDRTIVFQTTVSGTSWSQPGRIQELYDALLQRLRAMPGVETVGVTTQVLEMGDASLSDVVVDGRESVRVSDRPLVSYALADAESIHMSGRLLKHGRLFGADDRATPLRLAVVNDAFVRAAFPDGPVIGRRVALSALGNDPLEIIGVVSDAAVPNGALPDQPRVFYDYALAPASRFIVLARFVSGGLPTATSIRQVVHAVDPALPVIDFQTVQAAIGRSTAPRRWSWMLVLTFATVALLLASVGLYGTVAYEAARRRRECGIRLALGASPAAIRALVARAGLVPVAGGLVAGSIGSVIAGRLLRGFLYGTDTLSWLATGACELTLFGLACGICLVAAVRAARVDPARVLRQQ